MRILVSNKNIKEVLDKLSSSIFFGLDTETTGLNPYQGRRIFSLILSTKDDDFYFNFNDKPDHLGDYVPKEYVLDRKYLSKAIETIDKKGNSVFIQSYKFDAKMLLVEGIDISEATGYCTQALARVVNNLLPKYNLAYLGELLGHPKDDAVEKYISKHKLYTLVDVGKKKPKKDKHFDLVPFKLISEYGLTDGRVVFEVGMYILKRIFELQQQHEENDLPSILDVFNNEVRLTQTLLKMEHTGIKIDRAYVEEAYEYELAEYKKAAEEFEFVTGIKFEDSAKCFKEAFKQLGLEPGKTEKGNPSFSEENLPDNEVTRLILKYRRHYKRAGTYFKNYLLLADENDIIHCNFVQGGTVTGRMSSMEPNLQNVPKRGEDDSKYPIRRCFIPRPGYFLAMIDWDQMEYRMLLDRAGEMGVIDKILNEGLDVHTATGEEMSATRDAAKQLNFLLLYGGGYELLAEKLNILVRKAKELKAKYFRKLTKVKGLVKGLEAAAKTRGFIVNWLGRRLTFHKERPYVMPNHYIQGGCGDVCKVAMNDIDDYLANCESRLLLQVHDELIFEIKYGEENLLDVIKTIMETTYPSVHIPLTAGVEYSKTDWFNKKEFNYAEFTSTSDASSTT